jgi:acetyl-CoA carboxylase biotin carboxyl carrier protein
MDLTDEDVQEILKLFEHSKFNYLNLEQGGRRITLSKPGYVPTNADSSPGSHVQARQAAPTVAPPPKPFAAPAASVPAPQAEEGLMSINAPMMGVFYAASSPSEPPFVQAGQHVEPGATLGLIEVMKVFASIKSDVAGTLEKMLVANGQTVAVNQPLFLIRPEA